MAINKDEGNPRLYLNKNITIFNDIYEYDIKSAFPTYLNKKLGYNLSYCKDKYLYEVGLIIKNNKNIRDEIINYIKTTFENLFHDHKDNIKIYRFYVDEILTNININDEYDDYIFNFDIFTIKKKTLNVFVNTKLINGFIKVYKNGDIKIDKKTILPYADRLIRDILDRDNSLKNITKLYLSGGYKPENYIVKDRDLMDVIILDNLAYKVDIDDINKNINLYGKNILSNINKKYYYNLLFTYINLLRN